MGHSFLANPPKGEANALCLSVQMKSLPGDQQPGHTHALICIAFNKVEPVSYTGKVKREPVVPLVDPVAVLSPYNSPVRFSEDELGFRLMV